MIKYIYIYIFFYLFLDPCKTLEGNSCKFPFLYNGKSYNGCTREYSTDYWCPIKLDLDSGSTQAAWGYCTGKCPQNCNETMYVFTLLL